MALPQELQDGRYRPERLLGSGGMGEVYLMEDTRVKRHVAIKIIRSESNAFIDEGMSSDAARLFEREARAIATLEHPNILPLYDFGEEIHGEVAMTYMVMPYCAEGSLASWLRQRGNATRLSLPDVIYFIGQAAEGLQYAHDQQMIHLDVKPPNFLLRANKRQPQHPILLLADFGIARSFTTVSSSSRTIRGTPTSMAPEQWRGEPVLATDQYALAIMAYELLTGQPPFTGSMEQLLYHHLSVAPTPPSTIRAHIPEAIDAVLLRALAKKPEDRFPSISAFATALEEAIQPLGGAISSQLSQPGQEYETMAVAQMEVKDGSLEQMVTIREEETSVPASISQEDIHAVAPVTPAEALQLPDTISQFPEVGGGKTQQQESNQSTPVLLPSLTNASSEHNLPTVAISESGVEALSAQQPSRSKRSRVFLATSIALVCILIVLLFAGAVYFISRQQPTSSVSKGVTATVAPKATIAPTSIPRPTPKPAPGLYIAGSYQGSMTDQTTGQAAQITVYLVQVKGQANLLGSVTFTSPTHEVDLLHGTVDTHGNFAFHVKQDNGKQPLYLFGQLKTGNFLQGNYCSTSASTCLSITGYFNVGPRY